MCTATRTSSYSPVGPSVCVFVYLALVFPFDVNYVFIGLCVPILLCFPGQLSPVVKVRGLSPPCSHLSPLQ